eukprot:SAG31_NODE_3070_length_4721_cov_2.214626_2_plen_306_part_01
MIALYKGNGRTPSGLKTAEALVRAGADVNKCGSSGQPPLHMVCMLGKPSFVRLLLAAPGIDPNMVYKGDTALIVACQYGANGSGKWQCVEPLLAHPGVDRNVKSQQPPTTLKVLIGRAPGYRGLTALEIMKRQSTDYSLQKDKDCERVIKMFKHPSRAITQAGALWNAASPSRPSAASNVSPASITQTVRQLANGDSTSKENAAAALKRLAFNNDNQVAIAEAGAVAPLVRLLTEGSAGAQEQAAMALHNLAANNDNQVAIVQAGAVAPLVRLLTEGSAGAQEYASRALGSLALNANNRVVIAQAG